MFKLTRHYAEAAGFPNAEAAGRALDWVMANFLPPSFRWIMYMNGVGQWTVRTDLGKPGSGDVLYVTGEADDT